MNSKQIRLFGDQALLGTQILGKVLVNETTVSTVSTVSSAYTVSLVSTSEPSAFGFIFEHFFVVMYHFIALYLHPEI